MRRDHAVCQRLERETKFTNLWQYSKRYLKSLEEKSSLSRV